MKTLIILLADMISVMLAFSLAWLFHINFNIYNVVPSAHALLIGSVSLFSYAIVFFAFSIPKVIWRYVSLRELFRLSLSVFAGLIISVVLNALIVQLDVTSVLVLILQAMFYLSTMLLSRCIYRFSLIGKIENKNIQSVLIIGAGRASENLVRDMLSHTAKCSYRPVALLDDDVKLHGRIIHGVKVVGSCSQLDQWIKHYSVGMVIIAMPSLSDRFFINSIYSTCSEFNCSVRVLPGLMDIADGKVTVDALRQVDIEDLLGRDPIEIINDQLSDRLANKTVWVTGGGGSIGSELSRQIAANNPTKLVIIENNEYNLYRITEELKQLSPLIIVIALLVDVSHYDDLEDVFKHHAPDIIFHASAFKHVPLLEDQVSSAVRNNILATQSLCDLANKYHVANLVLVSTDKAVNPTNLMGMSKRMAEIYTQNINRQSNTLFSTVRFGNVLGSTGSVLPLFRRQLKSGGPLTITDPKMTRYFMMIPEAASLILQSFLLGEGGDIFVLDMGDPVNIQDLAEKLITLSGKKPHVDVEIKCVGIRPGEKLYEELFYKSESLQPTLHQKIFKAQVREYDWADIKGVFSSLRHAYESHDCDLQIKNLVSLVPEYSGQYQLHDSAIADRIVY